MTQYSEQIPPLEQATALLDSIQLKCQSLTDAKLVRFREELTTLFACEQPNELMERARSIEQSRSCWSNINGGWPKAQQLQQHLWRSAEQFLESEAFRHIREQIEVCLTAVEREADDRQMKGLLQQVKAVNPVVGYSAKGKRKNTNRRPANKRDTGRRKHVHQLRRQNRKGPKG